MTVQWIEDSPGTVGQRAGGGVRAAAPMTATALTRTTTTRAAPVRAFSPTFPVGPVLRAPIAYATPPSSTWHFVVNDFQSSGNLELAPGQDPRLAACEWIKANNFDPSFTWTIDAWQVGAGGWVKKFTFTTDAAFWATDCAAWVATSTHFPGVSGALGQAPPTNWTGVPEPPFWAFTGLPWPPTGPLPATAPQGWKLLKNVPKPPDYTGVWPPPWPPTADMVPGWPADWPFPLPAAPPAAQGGSLPTPPQQPALPPPPAQPQPTAPAPAAKSGLSTGVAIALGLGLLSLLLLAASGAAPLAENPCPSCGGRRA